MRGTDLSEFESRAEIAAWSPAGSKLRGDWPRDPDGAPLYPGTAKCMPAASDAPDSAGEPYALRLDMAPAIARVGALTWTETGQGRRRNRLYRRQARAWGDVILARKETPTSYHLAVVIDDAAQGVTDVVRGRDLFLPPPSIASCKRCSVPQPAITITVILDEDGRKLSKSTRSTGCANCARKAERPRISASAPGSIERTSVA